MTRMCRPGPRGRGLRLTPFDADGRFVPSGGAQEVRRLAVLGVGATTLSQAFGVACQVAWTVVLARLLVPADFGLITMVTTFSLLLLNAGLNGLTEAVIQCDDIDHATASALFWVALATGAACSVAFAAAGPLIALFFHDPRVAQVAGVMSLSIFLTSTEVVHRALLMRAMCFTLAYASGAAARAASFVVAVVLASAGWGYWALVAAALAQPLGETVGAWFLCRWRPGPPGRCAKAGGMLRFALNVYGRFSFNYLARNVDNLLVGWRFHAAVLGYYKKAYDLFAFSVVFHSFAAVAVSALSRFRQDGERYRRYVLNVISIAAFFGVAMGGLLALSGRDLIRLLLGPQWDPAGDIFVCFAPGVAATFVYTTHGWIHLSSGTPDKWLRWGVVEFGVTAASFLVGMRWGAVGVAAASSVAWCLLVLPGLWYAGRSSGLRILEVVDALWRPVAAGITAAGCTALVVGLVSLPPVHPGWLAIAARLGATSVVFLSLYVVLIVAVHGSAAPLQQVGRLVMDLLPRRAAAGPADAGFAAERLEPL